MPSSLVRSKDHSAHDPLRVPVPATLRRDKLRLITGRDAGAGALESTLDVRFRLSDADVQRFRSLDGEKGHRIRHDRPGGECLACARLAV